MKQRKMNKQASNDMMEREFNILQTVESLHPPAALYNKILSRIEDTKMTISKKWLVAAAAIFAVVLCIEVFIGLQKNNQSQVEDIELLMNQENHQLYE